MMKNIFLLFSLIIIIILLIFILISCDILTKMNEQEWEDKNIEEEEKKEINVYITGSFSNGVIYNISTIKMDLFNKRSNKRIFNNGLDDLGYSIATNNNNIYVAGLSLNGTDDDFLIIKYDMDLNPINNRIIDFGANEFFNGITCDSLDNIYTVGTSNNDIFIFKFDSNLNPLFSQSFDINGGADYAYGIAYNNNFLYVVGLATQPPGEQAGDQDIVIIKCNSSNLTPSIFQYYPLNPFGELNSHQAKDIVIDKYGNIYVIGYVDIGGPCDCILLKYDTDLNLIWNKTIDIDYDDKGEGVAVDDIGNIYLALHCRPNAGNFDCYTIKYDPFGNEVWRKRYGTLSVNDQLWDIAVDPLGNVYSVGNSNDNYIIIVYNYFGEQKNIFFYDNGNFENIRSVAISTKNF